MTKNSRPASRSARRDSWRAGAILAATAVIVGVLGVIGLDVEDHLDPTSLRVSGTASAEGEALMREHFGDSSLFTIVLQGPAEEIDRQGPSLVRALRRDPAATTISAWDSGGVSGLRPGPRRALILVDFHLSGADAVRQAVPEIERTLAERIRPPLVATQSGYATIARALQEESLSATERAELLAVPLLILVLLAVFRSLVAAAIPLVFGALTVLAGRGVLVLLSSVMEMDALALVVCTMMGLALGVDYSLLIVSRFREELRAGSEPRDAARRTGATAGRTTIFAGSTLFVSIFASAFVQPGGLFVSFATALVVVTGISVAIAAVSLPALLALLGERVNAGRIGSDGTSQGSFVARIAKVALRRPSISIAMVSVPLILLASPAIALNAGSPGVDELPADNDARQDAETIAATVGPGWEAPFVLTAASRGPITTPERLEMLALWQRRIATRPGVRTVIGPAAVVRRTRSLRGLERQFASPHGERELARLGPGLHRASTGVARLRAGIARAAAGSALLDEGSARAGTGADLLADALGRAVRGGERSADALDRLASGSKRLATAQREAAVGGLTLSLGVTSLLPRVSGSLQRAKQLADGLEEEASADPALLARAREAAIVERGLASSREELQRLEGIASALNRALNRIAAAGRRLQTGSGALATAAGDFSGKLGQLRVGTVRLARGLDSLQGGAGALRNGLAEGFSHSHPLQAGLSRTAVRISTSVGPLRRAVGTLRRQSPHLFDSGYLLLSALDGAPPSQRTQSGEAIDIDGGGQAARLLVIPSSAFNSAGSRATGAMLLADAERLGEEGGFRTGLSGGAATLNDYGEATRAGLLPVVVTVLLVTLLMLVAILRAPLLAALALGLNLFAVIAAIGVISLVCQIPAGYPLGGHPYIDTVGAAGIFGITFGLSIDYSVFLIARMRERWEASGDNAAAVAFGLEKTAGVVTGAAAIMAAVFITFAAAPVATVSQMGIGLVVAILLDATVVRIVLLPAFMLLIGEKVWHVPPALDRLLPDLNVHGGGVRKGAA